MPPLPGPAASVEREHLLHSVEQLRRHQSLVPPGVLPTLVLYDPEVVAVNQDVVELLH
nr:hypothetical protein [Streptacidiphilus jeojiense]